jgi:hypothetical protein
MVHQQFPHLIANLFSIHRIHGIHFWIHPCFAKLSGPCRLSRQENLQKFYTLESRRAKAGDDREWPSTNMIQENVSKPRMNHPNFGSKQRLLNSHLQTPGFPLSFHTPFSWTSWEVARDPRHRLDTTKFGRKGPTLFVLFSIRIWWRSRHNEPAAIQE